MSSGKQYSKKMGWQIVTVTREIASGRLGEPRNDESFTVLENELRGLAAEEKQSSDLISSPSWFLPPAAVGLHIVGVSVIVNKWSACDQCMCAGTRTVIRALTPAHGRHWSVPVAPSTRLADDSRNRIVAAADMQALGPSE